jgi:phosphate transport system substrate-binding protein
MKLNILSSISLLIFLGCSNPQTNKVSNELPSHQGKIKITGAFALYPLVQQWITDYQKANPKVEFELSAIGSGNGLDEILNGKTDIAMISSQVPAEFDTLLWISPVARLAVVPIISKKNPYLQTILKNGIKKDDLLSLFTNQNPRTWGDIFGKPTKDPVKVYIRNDKSGATVALANYFWIKPDEIKGIGETGELKMIESIKADPLALGYCNLVYTYDLNNKEFFSDFCILPIDLNQNGVIDKREDFYHDFTEIQRAMYLGKYPCVLNRSLYVVTKGKPNTSEVVDFLKWVLTNGQGVVPKLGYIELRNSEIRYNLYYLTH